ncbi:MAG: hypothetical protein JJU33_10855 [Phycisphaerales bacterium]|nr:hypothetical protein [Phycisphaerales bacterium]
MDKPPSTAEQPRSARSHDAPPVGLPAEAERRAMQAIWWWRGTGLGLLVLVAIDIVVEFGPGRLLAVDILNGLAVFAGLGGIFYTQIRWALTFRREGLVPGWLVGLWISAVVAVPLLWVGARIAGGQGDEAAIGPVSWVALIFSAIGAGLLVMAAVDFSVAARTGSPLLRLRHRPLVMGLLLILLWMLEIYGVIGFDRAQSYSFIVVMVAPWLLHLNNADAQPAPAVTPRSAAV